MDWLKGMWASPKKDDPVSKLNPELKEFLREQRPAKYETTPAPPPAEIPTPKQPRSLPDTNRIHNDRPLPKESLFQDGRYANLWKTYTPQTEIDAVEPPEKQVVNAYKGRRHRIHLAALENCAIENELLYTCFDTGNWRKRAYARATMCNMEERRFNRCYQLQAVSCSGSLRLASSNSWCSAS